MTSPFSFAGQIRPLPYALWSSGIFFSQHLVVFLASTALGESLKPDWDFYFYVLPLRWLVTLSRPSALLLLFALAYMLVAAWLLAALAFRRAANADISEWIAAFAIAPVIQIPVILFLCLAPASVAARRSDAAADIRASASDWAAAAQGLVAGMGLTLLAVAASTLVFRVYGWGLFWVSPFVIGAITAYFGNRRGDMGVGHTVRLVAIATALGGIALVMVALEGIVCIVLAAPLGFGAALIGGLLGRAIAVSTRRSPKQTLSGFALLPLAFALENVLPATTYFDTYETIEINAPPQAVWNSIVHMDTIGEPLALPFRLGVAYPLRGEVIGEGVGAVRHGEFSTGTAIERVTEWVPNRKLAFVVLDDVPAMRELSPYRHVHAPHAVGYFRTTSTSFELSQHPDGRTGIIERTSHELKLDPVLYWLPLARWVIHANNARILAHIRRQAERNFGTGG